jgi:hypothetical protein
LSGFKGYLHVDGYPGYHKVSDVTLVGCWAHARRKYDEALKAAPQAKGQSETVDGQGLAYCNALFAIERELQDATLLGQAIAYSLNQWEKLTAFLKDGRLEIDNNRSERSIKPFVIGRKNWLFANTPRGAKASAAIYSVIETAKENGLHPFQYLKYVFEQLPQLPDPRDPEALEPFLPWSKALPLTCRVFSF